jgi:hypothetical protein
VTGTCGFEMVRDRGFHSVLLLSAGLLLGLDRQA